MPSRCRVCGTEINPEVIPASSHVAFMCWRCRSQLELKVAPDSVLIVAVSLVFAAFISASLHVEGIEFIVAMIASTAVLNYVGQAIYRAIRAPRLQKSRPTAKAMRLVKGARQG